MKLAKHTRMNTEQTRSCPEIDSLLIKQISGELSADDKNYIESHLAGCASCVGEEQWLSKVWQKFDTLPDPEIPPKLYETTHETILDHLKWEKSSFPWIAAHSILVTLLTLIIAYLAYETELFRGPAMFAASLVAAESLYLFGMGNTLVTSWWIHCCLASFIGALTFSVRQLALEPRYLLVASLVVTTLLLPAILLQGASHNHGYGIIAFAALGTYVGSLLGLRLGFFLRRQIFFQPV